MADGIARPLAHIIRLVLRVHVDDAHVVNLFHQDHDGVRRLHDLIVVVVEGRQHGRTGHRRDDAALGESTILYIVDAIGAPRQTPAGRRHHGRYLSIRRINDHRGTLNAVHARQTVAHVVEENVVGAGAFRSLGLVQRAFRGAVQFLPGLVLFLLPLFGLGIGKRGLTGKLSRAFERRARCVGPDAIERRMPIRRARNVRFGRGGLILRRKRNGRKCRKHSEAYQSSMSHTLTSDRAYTDFRGRQATPNQRPIEAVSFKTAFTSAPIKIAIPNKYSQSIRIITAPSDPYTVEYVLKSLRYTRSIAEA